MNNKTDFKKLTAEFLNSGISKQTARDLKDSFGIPMKNANKGVLLLCALFDLAVNKGSVPAAKELISLYSLNQDSGENILASILKEAE